jgi:hypothetical protein
MDNLEKKRYDREMKRKRQLEEDLKPELMLKEEMDNTKRRIGYNGSKDPVIERIRGYVLLEGKEEESDYQLVLGFNELSVKSFKNHEKRLEPVEHGILMYGKNLTDKDG